MQLPPVFDAADGHLPLGDIPRDTPPKGRRASGPRRPRKWDADQQIVEGLTRYYSMSVLLTRGNEYDSLVILSLAGSCAQGWLDVGHRYPAVYETLKVITTGTWWMPVLMAHLALTVGISANHGVLNPSWTQMFNLPVPPPRQAQEAASAEMGSMDRPPFPYEVPVSEPMPARTDASALGVGLTDIPAEQRVEFDSNMIEAIKRQAIEAELAQRAAFAAQQQQQATGMPGYNPADVGARAEQNPTFLQSLVQRRG